MGCFWNVQDYKWFFEKQKNTNIWKSDILSIDDVTLNEIGCFWNIKRNQNTLIHYCGKWTWQSDNGKEKERIYVLIINIPTHICYNKKLRCSIYLLLLFLNAQCTYFYSKWDDIRTFERTDG